MRDLSGSALPVTRSTGRNGCVQIGRVPAGAQVSSSSFTEPPLDPLQRLGASDPRHGIAHRFIRPILLVVDTVKARYTTNNVEGAEGTVRVRGQADGAERLEYCWCRFSTAYGNSADPWITMDA